MLKITKIIKHYKWKKLIKKPISQWSQKEIKKHHYFINNLYDKYGSDQNFIYKDKNAK